MNENPYHIVPLDIEDGTVPKNTCPGTAGAPGPYGPDGSGLSIGWPRDSSGYQIYWYRLPGETPKGTRTHSMREGGLTWPPIETFEVDEGMWKAEWRRACAHHLEYAVRYVRHAIPADLEIAASDVTRILAALKDGTALQAVDTHVLTAEEAALKLSPSSVNDVIRCGVAGLNTEAYLTFGDPKRLKFLRMQFSGVYVDMAVVEDKLVVKALGRT